MPDPLPEYKRLALGQRRKDLLQEYQAASKQLSQALGAVEQERIKRQIAHLEEQIQEIERQLGTPPAPVEADEVHSTPPTDGKPSLEPAKEPQPGAKPVTPSTPDVAPPKSGLGGWFSRLPDAGKAAVITGLFAVIVALISLLAQLIPAPPDPAPAATPTPMSYVVRVDGQNSAGTGITDAKVTLYVRGRPPLDKFTDSDGVAVLAVPSQYAGDSAVMIVEAMGFETYRKNITLQLGQLPVEARLLPMATVSSPAETTTTLTETNIPTPMPALPTILNLQNGALVPHRISLLGEYPAGLNETIWVFVAPRFQRDVPPSTFYPQSYNPCEGSDGAAQQSERWEQQVLVGQDNPSDAGLRFDLIVTTATDEGHATVAAEIQRWCDEKVWPGFTAMPVGVSEVARMTIIRSDERLRAPDPSVAQLPGLVNITFPSDGQTVTNTEVISGTYSNLLADHAIWTLVYATSGKWFPQSMDACAGIHAVAENGQWQVTANFQTSYSGEPFDVVAVVADAEANAFFDQQQRQWCAQAAASPDFRWPGLLTIELPAGITEKDRIHLFHQ